MESSETDQTTKEPDKTAEHPVPRRWELDALTPAERHPESFNVGSWANASDKLDEHNVLWKQYAVMVDLYRFYIDLAWKVNVWYYVTSGAILTYFFANVGQPESPVLPYLLLFYGGASIGFGYLFWRGGGHLNSMIDLFEGIAEKLRLPGRPHVEFGCAFLLISALMYVALGVAAIALYFIAPWAD